MFIAVKRNVLLPDKNGARKKFLARSYVGELSEDFDTPYFRALVKDGDIVLTESHSDKVLVPEMDKAPKVRRKKSEG